VAGETSTEVLAAEVRGMGREMGEVKAALRDVSAALRTLASVEQVQISQQAAITRLERSEENKEERLQAVEKTMPSLKEMRLWIISGFGALLLAGVVAAFSGNIAITVGAKAHAVERAQ
jgi:predicted RNase H-like nuclease (RuvC/YqgF family)